MLLLEEAVAGRQLWRQLSAAAAAAVELAAFVDSDCDGDRTSLRSLVCIYAYTDYGIGALSPI